MKQICNKLFFVLAGCLLTSCSEEIFGGDGASGQDVTLTLNYEQSLPKKITVTRASSGENALHNLQIFIFGEDGKLKGYRWITHNSSSTDTANDENYLDQTGNKKSVSVKTKTGKSYIYAVANVSTSIYNLDESDTKIKLIPTNATEAWDEDDARNGDIDFTLSDLKKIPFLRTKGELRITEENFMMSGMAYEGNLCEIAYNSNGKAYITKPTDEDYQLIKLRRIVSKVKFKVAANTGITFTPTSYELREIPQKGWLIEDSETAKKDITDNDFNDSYSSTFVTNDQETVDGTTYDTFTLYLPENIQNHNIKNSSITTWADRETDNGGSTKESTKAFTYAPEHGTYLILKGKYTGPLSTSGKTVTIDKTETNPTVNATVTYYIHLGDFKTNISDFNVERNCFYTYTITINGVHDLWVEVDKETDEQTEGSTEGLVFNLVNGKVYDLDSHYCKLDMIFTPSTDVTTQQENGETKSFVYFMAKDLRGDTGICRLVKDSKGNYSIEKGNSGMWSTAASTDEPNNLDWIEFLEGSNQNYPKAANKTSANGYYGGLIALLRHLIEIKDQTTSITYTCFINENYYKDHNWGDFVNIDPRYFYICRDLSTSNDKRTIRGAVIYGATQRSIQTVYNTAEDGSIIAYGCETNPNDNYGGKSCNMSNGASLDTPLDFIASGNGVGTDTWDGWSNMINDLDQSGWNVRNWYTDGQSSIAGYQNYQRARYACMSRNRDNDGDGVIDDDEVRWYCPTLQQYAGLIVGEEALSSDARMYTGNTSTLGQESSANWQQRYNGTHYYFNENQNSHYIWAEEGLAVSNNAGTSATTNPSKLYVRCIRNLKSKGTGVGTKSSPVVPDTYYEPNSGYTVNLHHMNTKAVRTSYQESELTAHIETSVLNAPAQKFQCATGLTTSATTMVKAVSDKTTVCGDYHEDTDKSDKWRAPNQSELILMYVLKLTSNSHQCCRTKFSNDSFRYSWEVNPNGQLEMRETSNGSPLATDESFYIRCVRDVK